jgi:hypothetical protein
VTALIAAADALARLDDGEARPGDRVLVEVFDRHANWGAAFCLICGTEGQGKECDHCYLLRDVEVEQASDV